MERVTVDVDATAAAPVRSTRDSSPDSDRGCWAAVTLADSVYIHLKFTENVGRQFILMAALV